MPCTCRGHSCCPAQAKSSRQHCFTLRHFLQEALRYSPGQIADLLTVRQLFFTKLGHLRDARGAALAALSQCIGDLHETKVHTDQMQALVEETYHTYLQFGVACHFGVGHSMFAAKVHSGSCPWHAYQQEHSVKMKV